MSESKNVVAIEIGFIAMLVWHYLVLFTPILANCYIQADGANLSNRQFTLYLSLAITFSLIAAVSSRMAKHLLRFSFNPKIICAAGIVSTLASALCAIYPATSIAAATTLTIALGASEGFMMWMWLCFIFADMEESCPLHEFSYSMIFAGIASVLICYLQHNANTFVTILLPILSTGILLNETRGLYKQSLEIREAKKQKEQIEQDKTAASLHTLEWEKTVRTAKKLNLGKNPPQKSKQQSFSSKNINMFFSMGLLAVFGTVFGILQGFYVKYEVFLLMSNTRLPLIGIAIAGATFFLSPKKHGTLFGANVLHHYALVFVVASAVLLAQQELSTPLMLAAEITMLAGFNLFDSSAMLIGIRSSFKEGARTVHLVSGGRPVVYTSLAIGILLGHQLAMSSSASLSSVTISGIAIVLLVATTLIPYYSYSVSSSAADDKKEENFDTPEGDGNIIASPLSSTTLSLDEKKMQHSTMGPWRTACTEIAKLYQLSPRETEVFMMMAKGRNASYIQEKLVISPHTAKTHIANTYRKLEIHSSQELLDLIESFREAERHFSEENDDSSNS